MPAPVVFANFINHFNPLGIMRWVLRSKIHKATVTEADLNYIGSITIDEDLIERAGFWPGEKVLVVSNTSGVRLETYIIVGKRNSGTICMNGAAAHLIKKGEEIIVMGFELADKPVKAKNILVDKKNKFVRCLQ
jgi:aspartate 1-decarboxylase